MCQGPINRRPMLALMGVVLHANVTRGSGQRGRAVGAQHGVGGQHGLQHCSQMRSVQRLDDLVGAGAGPVAHDEHNVMLALHAPWCGASTSLSGLPVQCTQLGRTGPCWT